MTHKAKVIIVDDSISMRSVLRTLLANEGYKILGEYGSGRALLEAVDKLRPDIICLDYNLPNVNGLELLKEIHETYPTVAVVMITGSESSDLEKAAADAGASGFLHKPFTQDKIIKDLHQVVLAQRLLASAHHSIKSNLEKTERASTVIADDSSAMRMLLATILKEANIKVVGEARNGLQAVEMVKEHNPDFVCLDIEMPVMNGIEALKNIYLQQPNIWALMITASSDRNCVIQASKMGARGYIIKPYQPTKVIDTITKLLN